MAEYDNNNRGSLFWRGGGWGGPGEWQGQKVALCLQLDTEPKEGSRRPVGGLSVFPFDKGAVAFRIWPPKEGRTDLTGQDDEWWVNIYPEKPNAAGTGPDFRVQFKPKEGQAKPQPPAPAKPAPRPRPDMPF